MTRLYRESPLDAALDVAVSHALLRSGTAALRVWVPPPALSFGRLDLLSPTREHAIAAARDAGLTPVRRLAGGRAAPIGPATVCVGWACPGPELPETQARYEMLAHALIEALSSLGLAARTGELAGEWCPGSWSILVGATKVAGLAQRVIRLGAWVEAVIVVDAPDEVRRALDAVQRGLGAEWTAATFAGLTDERPELTRTEVIEAVHESLRTHWEIHDAHLTRELWEQARALRHEHVL